MVYKMFGGRRYQSYITVPSKKQADYYCDGLRQNGFYARYERDGSDYVVYRRKK